MVKVHGDVIVFLNAFIIIAYRLEINRWLNVCV